MENKVCSRCKKEYPITEFKINKKMKSGRVNQCRLCLNEDAKKARHNHIEEVRQRDRNRSRYDERYRQQKREKREALKLDPNYKEILKKYRITDREVNKDKYEVRKITKEAIRKGELIRKPCEVCGKENGEAHHNNYDDPFDISWLCKDHHLRLHAELRDKERALK